jgi:hypothetical protein
MRLLDQDAQPLGEVRLLFERNWVGPAGTLLWQEDHAVLSYCGRYDLGRGILEDRATSVFLDSSGNVLSEWVREPSNRHCSFSGTTWTGTHLLFSTISASWPGGGHFVERALADGTGLGWEELSADDAFASDFAVGHGRVLRVVGSPSAGIPLTVHHYSLDGRDRGPMAVLEPIPYELDEMLFSGQPRGISLVPVEDGWLVLGALPAQGIYVAHLDPEGGLDSPPRMEGADFRFANGLTDVIAFQGGAVLIGRAVILYVSSDVRISPEKPQDTGQSASGLLFEHQGRLFVIYAGALGPVPQNTNQVIVREIACRP